MNDRTITTQITANRGNNGVATVATPTAANDATNILIIEPDEDCADALETILSDLPGIASVRLSGNTYDAIDLLNGECCDVVGFGLVCDNIPAPDVIFIGTDQPDAFEIEPHLAAALAAFRSRVPDVSIVLLCVYPDRYRAMLGGLVDGCIRKDTSARELTALIDDLRASRAAA